MSFAKARITQHGGVATQSTTDPTGDEFGEKLENEISTGADDVALKEMGECQTFTISSQ